MTRFDSPKFLKNAGKRYNPPLNIDMTKPSIARGYSYYLGGKDHFEVDRTMADHAEEVVPGTTELALGNRAFVQRAVRYLSAERGIDQFLDIGSGLPSDGNVHEIAHEDAPHAHVVYVDNDPIVLAHARALLTGDSSTVVITADLLRPQEVLHEAEKSGLIDFGRPVGLILGGILHHLHDREEPRRLTRELCDALAPGSHLAISHFHRPDSTQFPSDALRAEHLEKAFLQKLGTGRWRTHEEIASYFGDWTLVEPGMVPLNEWRPLPLSTRVPGSYRMPQRNCKLIAGGIARKP